jgi:glutamyl-tRNA reductase
MNQQFKALILTYKTASLALREQVSLNEGSIRQLLKFIQEYTPASEALVISTCNRTEIYYSAE